MTLKYKTKHTTPKFYLTEKHNTGDKIIRTTAGDFKIRKNGKVIIKIEDEVIRVVPVSSLTKDENKKEDKR